MTTSTIALTASARSSRARRAPRRRVDDPIHLLPVPARQLRLEVLLWAFRYGRPVDADALSCVLLAKDSHVDDPLTLFTADAVRRLLWVDIVAQCTALERRPPERVAATMWTLLDFLDTTNALAPGSDALEHLREPLIDSGGITPRTRTNAARRRADPARRRHPAGR